MIFLKQFKRYIVEKNILDYYSSHTTSIRLNKGFMIGDARSKFGGRLIHKRPLYMIEYYTRCERNVRDQKRLIIELIYTIYHHKLTYLYTIRMDRNHNYNYEITFVLYDEKYKQNPSVYNEVKWDFKIVCFHLNRPLLEHVMPKLFRTDHECYNWETELARKRQLNRCACH